MKISLPTWAWLTLIAAAPRLLGLGAEALWYDEAFTAWVAQLDMQNMLGAITGDVHPPLYYLMQWVNIRLLGDSEFALRLPSTIFGIATVLLMWRLALEFGLSQRAAVTAAIFAAVMPSALYYSQEARMYAMLAFLVLGMLWGAVRGNWIVFVACAVLIFNTQNLGVFYVASIGGAAFIWHRADRRLLLVGIALAVAYVPNGLLVLKQAKDVADGFWIQNLTVGGSLEPFMSMSMGWRTGEALRTHTYGAAMGATLIGLAVWRGRRGWLLLAAIFGAPLLVALVSVAWHSIYLSRVFLPSTMLLCIIWAAMLHNLTGVARVIAIVIFVPSLALSSMAHYFPVLPRDDPRQWLAPMATDWQSGDVIYYLAIHSAVAQQRYAGERPYFLRPGVSDLNQTLTEETKSYMGFREAAFSELPSLGYQRAWALIYLNPMSRADEIQFVETLRSSPAAQVIAERGNDFSRMMIILVRL